MTGSDTDQQRLRFVVVNHNAGAHLRRCIEHLLAVEWPTEFEIRIVDNASTDDSLDQIADLVEANSSIEVLRQSVNEGFGANNRALDDLDTLTYVALVNPDAFVPRHFATTLAEELDGTTGAACPKIVFDEPFRSVRLQTSTADVRLVEVSLENAPITSRCHVLGADVARLPTAEGETHWHLGPDAELLVPAGLPGDLRLGFRSPSTGNVSIDSDGAEPVQIAVGPETVGHEFLLAAPAQRRIQNAGSFIDSVGIGGNRGFLQTETNAFAEPADVFAWCGAAVLLRADYLNDVGLFAPEFFLYYEDTDLSWRGQSQGWTYRYVPSVVVSHRHSASTGQGTEITDQYQQRNRLRMLARNASLGFLLRGAAHAAGSTAKIGARQLLAKRRPGSKGDSALFARRARGLVTAVGDLPSSLGSRRILNRRRTQDRDEVERRLHAEFDHR